MEDEVVKLHNRKLVVIVFLVIFVLISTTYISEFVSDIFLRKEIEKKENVLTDYIKQKLNSNDSSFDVHPYFEYPNDVIENRDYTGNNGTTSIEVFFPGAIKYNDIQYEPI